MLRSSVLHVKYFIEILKKLSRKGLEVGKEEEV